MIEYPWYSHPILYRVLVLSIKILNKEPLRIGAGRGSPLSPIDLPVITIRLPEGNPPYIPGSSLKGTFRSTAEYIVRSLGINACQAGACSLMLWDERERIRYGERLNRLLREGNEKEVIELLSRYCLICKLFGSSSFSSHLNFEDAYPTGGVSTSMKTGIAINRRSGAAQRGALYQVEFVNPGHEFKSKIVAKNVPNYGLGLLAVILDYLNEGIIKLGGFKSRGFGKVKVEVKEIKGKTLKDNSYISLSEVKKLPALDEYDIDIEINPDDIDGTLKEFKKAWWTYANRQRTVRG
ncbi:CRISPR-associated RAMP protein [Candidatus Bathyarchaeota archaeon]|nr:CRISPR-associated RAMP protein [Candidatus Bathyarchaeota archaeon]